MRGRRAQGLAGDSPLNGCARPLCLVLAEECDAAAGGDGLMDKDTRIRGKGRCKGSLAGTRARAAGQYGGEETMA